MIASQGTPQAGIFALGTASHAYLEFDLHDGADPRELVGRLADLREPRTTIGGSTSSSVCDRSCGATASAPRRLPACTATTSR
jgi:hypothetical protein